jgi:hypothetical protein
VAAATSPATPAPSRRLSAAVVLALVAPIWLIDPLPLQDLTSHEEIVALLVHGLDWSGVPERMAVDPSPRPYAVTYFLWAALAGVIGVTSASKALLTYALAGGVLCASRWVRQLDPAKGDRALLVALFACGEFYYLGLVQFLVALPSGYLLLSRVCGRQPQAPPGRAALALDAVLLLLTYLLHPLAGFLTGLLMAPFAVRPGAVVAGARRLLLVGLPCVAWAGLVGLLGTSRPLYPNYGLSLSGVEGLAALATAPVGGIAFWEGGLTPKALALGNLVAWVGGLLALLWRANRSRGALHPCLDATLMLGLAWLLLFPYGFHNGTMLNTRMLAFLLPLGLARLPVGAPSRPSRALTALALCASLATAWSAQALAARELRELAPVLAAMEPRQAVFHEGWVDSDVLRGRKLSLHSHAVASYTAHAGGYRPASPVLFSTSPVHVHSPLPYPAQGSPVPECYRYVIRAPLQPGSPEGYREVPLEGTRWRLLERLPRAPE